MKENAKLFYLLEELKENDSEENINNVIDCLEDDFIDNENNYEEIKQHFLNLPYSFFDKLSFNFIKDINDYPLTYFLIWEPLMSYFDRTDIEYFNKKCIDNSEGSDAFDFFNGIKYLNDGSPNMALLYFNRFEHFFIDYFIGIAYMEQNNYENAIKKNLSFLKKFKLTLNEKSNEEIELNELPSIKIVFWNIYNDLIFQYNSINEFTQATLFIDKTLNIIDVEGNINILHHNNPENDEFIYFANNILWAYEKINEPSKCIKILKEILIYLPNDIYYTKRLENCKKKKEDKESFEYVMRQVSYKKPFNLNSFQKTRLIAKEKNLEDMIVEQIKYGFKVFDKNLEIYQDEHIFGRQYGIKSVNGYLDLLLVDKETEELYLVELKRNKAGIEVVRQLENYIIGLSKEMNREIKGIICLHKPKDELVKLVKTKPNIELFTYEFNFKKID